MKTIKILIVITISVFSIQLSSQTLRYMYIHGKNTAGTADSVYYCGDITKIDSIDFHVNPYGFTDDFNAPTLSSNWTILSGVNNILNNASVATSNFVEVGNTAVVAKIVCNNPLATITAGKAFTLSVDYYINNATNDASTFPGIMFDISADNQKYQLIRNCGANTCQILATDNGGGSWAGVYQAGITPIPTTAQVWYRYTISYDGVRDGITLKITNLTTSVVTLNNYFATRAINGGKVGLTGYNGVGYFDNFSFIIK